MKNSWNFQQTLLQKPLLDPSSYNIKNILTTEGQNYYSHSSSKSKKNLSRYDQLSSIYKKIKMKINFSGKKMVAKEESFDYTFFEDSVIETPRLKKKKKVVENKHNISEAKTTLPCITCSNSSIGNIKSKSVINNRKVSKHHDYNKDISNRMIETLNTEVTKYKLISPCKYNVPKNLYLRV